jgi:hypothetical protein
MLKRMHGLQPICLVLLFFVLVLVACGGPATITTSAPPTSAAATQITATPAPLLIDLNGSDDLKARFNNDRGVPRIILLVSPT